jgi:2-iminobutanoate/2-iminopropanoate deaminase
MTKEIFNPGDHKPALPLSHAVRANGFVFISGQLPFLANGEYPQSFDEQVNQVFINLTAALAAAGLGLGDVVKTTVFLKSMENFAELNKIYGRYFSANPPARSTIEVARLPKDALVEIEAVAS